MWRKMAIVWGVVYLAVTILLIQRYLGQVHVFEPSTTVITAANAHRLTVRSNTSSALGGLSVISDDYLYYVEGDRLRVIDANTGRREGSIYYEPEFSQLRFLLSQTTCFGFSGTQWPNLHRSTNPRYFVVSYVRGGAVCTGDIYYSPNSVLVWDTQTLTRRDVYVSFSDTPIGYLAEADVLLVLDYSTHGIVAYPLDANTPQIVEAGSVGWHFTLGHETVYYQPTSTNELRRVNPDLSTAFVAPPLGTILRISPNGRFIVFDDGATQGVYDVETGDQWQFDLSGQTPHWHSKVEISRNSQWMVASTVHGQVALLDLETGAVAATLHRTDNAGEWILNFSTGGDVVLGVRRSDFRAWDLAGNELVRLTLPSDYATSLDSHPNGKLIIVNNSTFIGIE